jgi:hypothetical protein
MDRLFVALCAFVFGSASALADDGNTKPEGPATTPGGTPLIGDFDKMSTDQDRAARSAAKAKWEKMTPEEQADVEKIMRTRKKQDRNAMEDYVWQNFWQMGREVSPLTECEKQKLGGADSKAVSTHPILCRDRPRTGPTPYENPAK